MSTELWTSSTIELQDGSTVAYKGKLSDLMEDRAYVVHHIVREKIRRCTSVDEEDDIIAEKLIKVDIKIPFWEWRGLVLLEDAWIVGQVGSMYDFAYRDKEGWIKNIRISNEDKAA
jgi:hypothetical protein